MEADTERMLVCAECGAVSDLEATGLIIEEDRAAIQEGRQKRERQRELAKRAKRNVWLARRTLRRAAG